MRKSKLLIVDDENPEVMKELFEEFGFEVLVAEDGGAALEVAAAESPDLILLDIKLPVLNGYEVLEELKRRQIATRVVMYSAYFTDMQTAIRCVRNGACDFIGKLDFLPDELADKIKRYIIVEKTLNLQVSDLTPIVEKLIAEGESLEKEVGELRRKLWRLRVRRSAEEISSKIIYLAASVAAVYLLVKLELVGSGRGIAILFTMLFIFLLIPTGQLKNISAALKGLKARIELK